MRPAPAADRRRILRHALESAIGLDTTTRPGQTGAITATVWRVVEPALVQRDQQLDAVRDITTAMEGITGARFWADQLRGALRPQRQSDAQPAVQPPLAWCAASTPGLGGDPIGPCVLRAGHDGPVHQAASGAEWWPVDGGEIEAPEAMTEEQIDAFRAAWIRHYSGHEEVGTICAHSPSRVAESLDRQQRG